MTYGYVRVSSYDQNEDRQMRAMEEAGVRKKNVFIDKQSGRDFERPGYRRLMEHLKQGDTLCIMSIDRLGRDYEEILTQWRVITKERGVDIRVLDMPLLDTGVGKDLMGSFIADLVLQILSFVAQKERENIKVRQMQGIAAAKARGVMFGRPRKEIPEDAHQDIENVIQNVMSMRDLCLKYEVSLATGYRWRKTVEMLCDKDI